MKTIKNLLLAGGLALTTAFASGNAQAQCLNGYHNYSAPAPVKGRYYQFEVEGRAFVFDRSSGDIFCEGKKIGFRDAKGEVTIFPNTIPGAAPAAGGVGQPVVGGPATGGPVTGGPVVGSAAPGAPVGGVVGGGAVGGNAGPGAAAPGPGAAGPATGAAGPGAAAPAAAVPAPVNGQPGGAAAPAAAPSPAPAGGQAAPAAPAAGAPIPALGSGNDAAAAAAIAGPEISLESLSGQWRSETKDITGRVVVRELSFDEDKNATLRVQVQGQEPFAVQGPFSMKGGLLTISDGDDERELGRISGIDSNQLVLSGEGETLTFTRPQS